MSSCTAMALLLVRPCPATPPLLRSLRSHRSTRVADILSALPFFSSFFTSCAFFPLPSRLLLQQPRDVRLGLGRVWTTCMYVAGAAMRALADADLSPALQSRLTGLGWA